MQAADMFLLDGTSGDVETVSFLKSIFFLVRVKIKKNIAKRFTS